MDKYKISVPDPCTQNWDAMTPDAQGRFCSMCAKTVIDFTGLNDQHISQIVLAGKGKVCGRFKNEQLERVIIQIPRDVLFSQRHFYKAFLMALLVAMGTTLFSCTDHKGHSKPIDKVVVVDSLPIEKDQKVAVIDSVPEVAVDLPTIHPLHAVGKAVCEPVIPDERFIMGDVVYIPDSLLPPPPPVIKQVEAPKAIPENPGTETNGN